MIAVTLPRQPMARPNVLFPLTSLLPILSGTREDQVPSRLGLPSDAAAVAIGADRSDRAVELLEQGRSVRWTSVLNLRGDLTRLAARAPALSMELDRVRAALDRP